MGKIELAEHVVMHCVTLLDVACVWHLGTKGLLRSTLWGVQDK